MKTLSKIKLNIAKNLDKWLLFFTLAYSLIGIFLILSASSITSQLSFGTPYYYFERQIISVIISIFVSFIIMNIPTKYYGKLSKLLIGFLTFFLLYLFIKGRVVHGGNNEVSLSIFGFNFQPAEFIKVVLIMHISNAYYILNKHSHTKHDFLKPLIWCIIPFIFIFLGGDNGSAAIIALIVAIMILFVPTKEKLFTYFKVGVITILSISIIGLKFAYLFIENESDNYIVNRLNYKNPCDRYTSESGYQVCNGFIAIDNGGLFGVGIGKSTQKYLYLPASHTDFIFPIIVEELGVVVSVLLIIGYVFIAYRIFKISSSSYNLRNSLICFGVGIYFLLHIFINLLGVLGSFPLTGIPLPLFSYGGSNCLAMFCAFAMVQRICVENNIEKRNREIKRITS